MLAFFLGSRAGLFRRRVLAPQAVRVYTDIKVDNNGNVISILLSSKLLGFRDHESYDVIARGYAQSGSAYADGFLKFEVKSEISYENRRQIIKYFAESFNSNYERIVFMDGYVYLEQLPKGKF